MVEVHIPELTSLLAIVISVLSLIITITTTVSSRRGIVFKQYCDEFRNDPSIKKVIQVINNREDLNKISSYEISVFLFFYKELFLQIKTNNRIKKEVVSLMFLNYAKIIVKNKDIWYLQDINSMDWNILEAVILLLEKEPINIKKISL